MGSSPSFVAPWKNSTRVTESPGADAVAARAMVAGAVKVAPLDGLVRLTAGAGAPRPSSPPSQERLAEMRCSQAHLRQGDTRKAVLPAAGPSGRIQWFTPMS